MCLDAEHQPLITELLSIGAERFGNAVATNDNDVSGIELNGFVPEFRLFKGSED